MAKWCLTLQLQQQRLRMGKPMTAATVPPLVCRQTVRVQASAAAERRRLLQLPSRLTRKQHARQELTRSLISRAAKCMPAAAATTGMTVHMLMAKAAQRLR